MPWRTYQIIFRLRTPVHIGWGKAGNLQRTRPYVTGRVFWGAVTSRLTRDLASASDSPPGPQAYQRMGEEVHRLLGCTYFYPATASDSAYHVAWPWEHPARFRYRFLSSYSSTALTYPQQSAAAAMLHEVEFLAPYTLDNGEPVFLIGYVFERDGCSLPWQSACKRLQIGGERGYGWGDLALVSCAPVSNELFEGRAHIDGQGERPVITLRGAQSSTCFLLAHTLAANVAASGEIEPLVGREWRSTNAMNRYIGQHVTLTGICFAPGSKVDSDASFIIGNYGIWQ